MHKDPICHITTVHAATDVRIYHKEISSLIKASYPVTIIAPTNDKDHFEETFLLTILPLPKPVNRLVRFFKLMPMALSRALQSNAILCHFHDPELIFLALFLKLMGRRVIWDVHEDLPEQVMNKQWIPRWLRPIVARAFDWLERSIARFFDAVVVATPSISKRFKAARRVVVIQNFPKLEEMVVIDGVPYKNRPPHLVYIGGLTEIRGAREMVLAMGELAKKMPEAKLIFAGKFNPPQLEHLLNRLEGWSNVRFLGWVERQEAIKLLKSSRGGLVLFHPVPNHTEAMPNKLFEYMAAGIPVIASDFPLWREILMRERAGLLVNPKDPKAIAEAMSWILEHPDEAEAMGRRGQKAVLERYNWERESKKLLALYEELLG